MRTGEKEKLTRFSKIQKTNNYYIGIDPGASGAIAVIDDSQNVIMLQDWPGNEIAAAQLLRGWTTNRNIFAAIEKGQSMPKQGVRSMFSFGINCGIWKGILASFEIPFREITPRTWQKGVISKAQDKKPALAAAQRMFPSAEVTGPRGGAKDGRADALLIADWCRRQYA